MQVVNKGIDEIKPYGKNPRKNDAAVESVANSIREFGWQQPIVVDADGVIIAGHTRYKAAKSLGLDSVPVVYATDLSAKQVKAFRLADNKTGELAVWDFDLLGGELSDLLDFGMERFGFETERKVELDEDGEPIEDEDAMTVPDEPITRVGDVIKMGEHVLMCGDSTSRKDMARLMRGVKADLLLTDPPYNIDYEGWTKDKLKIKNDAFSDDASFVEFLHSFAVTAQEFMRDGAGFYIWHASNKCREFVQALDDTDLMVKQTIIWVKNTFTLGRQDYQWQHEPCLYGWKKGAAHSFIEDRTQTTVWDYDKRDLEKMTKERLIETVQQMRDERARWSDIWREDKPARSADHPTMKPVSLFAKSIGDTTDEGDVVLDPFGGSGTCLLACHITGRVCRTMELDPRFCDVIVRRFEEMTGEKAIRPRRAANADDGAQDDAR